MTDTTVMRLVAALARVRDDELRGAADQPDAQMPLRETVSTRIGRTSHRRRRFARLIAAAVRAAPAGVVADNLRETTAAREQRAALYAVAAMIPGVELVGPTADPAGRRGVAVAMDDRARQIRQTLVIDPATSRLLAEQAIALPGAREFPAGTRIESAVYLQTAVVDSMQQRPAR